MVTTTLADMPGPPFTPVGVVVGIASTPPHRAAVDDARRQMEAQAEALGADAVIDVRVQVVPTSHTQRADGLLVAFTGTAVKYSR